MNKCLRKIISSLHTDPDYDNVSSLETLNANEKQNQISCRCMIIHVLFFFIEIIHPLEFHLKFKL